MCVWLKDVVRSREQRGKVGWPSYWTVSWDRNAIVWLSVTLCQVNTLHGSCENCLNTIALSHTHTHTVVQSWNLIQHSSQRGQDLLEQPKGKSGIVGNVRFTVSVSLTMLSFCFLWSSEEKTRWILLRHIQGYSFRQSSHEKWEIKNSLNLVDLKQLANVSTNWESE